jgi:hypothetical protein
MYEDCYQECALVVFVTSNFVFLKPSLILPTIFFTMHLAQITYKHLNHLDLLIKVSIRGYA